MKQPLRILVPVFICAALGGCTATEDETEDPQFPRELADTWVRICPPEGAPDTLTLHADGRLVGSTTGFDSLGIVFNHWWVGDDLMPGGFCMGPGHRTKPNACQGFYLIGDTLAFGNQSRTVVIRVSRYHAVSDPRLRLNCQVRRARAPAPGDSVRLAPPAR